MNTSVSRFAVAMKSVRGGLLTIVSLAWLATPSQAASVAYFLDTANVPGLPDGINYMQVTISDGLDGAIDFHVEMLPALQSRAGPRVTIKAFAFNFDSSITLTSANIVGLPSSFKVQQAPARRMDGFGVFDVRLLGKGSQCNDSLSFSIVGIDGDSPSHYVDLSTGKAHNGNSLFAAHVIGLASTKGGAAAAFIGGGPEVPLPATAWLFLTGLAGALARTRRRGGDASRDT